MKFTVTTRSGDTVRVRTLVADDVRRARSLAEALVGRTAVVEDVRVQP